MPTVTERLTAAGLSIPVVVPPVAAYVPAVVTGRHVYVSGQLPMVNGEMIAAGLVSAEVDVDTAVQCARASALNAIAAAASAVGSVERITRVVKVVGFVASAPGFTSQPQVINGASELFQLAFGEAGVHARSAVGVAALPLNAPVEVEAIFEVAD